MKREEILKMAQEAGFSHCQNYSNGWINTMQRFAQLIAAHEREECAKVCDGKHYYWRWDDEHDSESGPRDCADAIRARK